MNPFYGLVSLAEAAELMGGLDPSTIRHAIAAGNFVEGRDCRKFGKQWVLTVESLCRYQGCDQARRKYEYLYGLQRYDWDVAE